MRQIWLLVAHPEEITGLSDWVSSRSDIKLIFTGVGLLESSYRFQKELFEAEEPPLAVLQAGTGGTMDAEQILTVRYSDIFSMPFSSDEEIPEFIETFWHTEYIPGLNLSKYEKMAVFSSFGITLKPTRLEQGLKRLRAQHTELAGVSFWENMEAVSLSYICHREKLPFGALLCSSNVLGSDGRSQWWQNFNKAGEMLLRELKQVFSG